MTLRELQHVPQFSIKNIHGEIAFDGETDLTDVDLAKIVTIEQGSAEVYADEDPTTVKPPIGQKLNKPAVITLYNMDLKKKTNHEDKVKAFK